MYMNSKQKIIDVAQKLFVEKGYKGASVREISGLAQVNISAISYYFAGKKGLYKACLEEFGRETLQHSMAEMNDPKDIEDLKIKLRNFLSRILDVYAGKPDLVRLVIKEIEDNSFMEETPGQGVFQELYFCLIKFLDEAKEKQLLKGNMESKIVASMFMGCLIQSICYDDIRENLFSVSLKEDNFRHSYLQHIVEVFLNGIQA